MIELAYFGGFTHTQIAEMLNMPIGTVKGRMRLGGIGLDLAPQPRDADVDAAVERLPVLVVREVEQAVPAQHPVRMVGEGFLEIVFHAGDRHVLAGGVVQPVRLEIELAGAEL